MAYRVAAWSYSIYAMYQAACLHPPREMSTQYKLRLILRVLFPSCVCSPNNTKNKTAYNSEDKIHTHTALVETGCLVQRLGCYAPFGGYWLYLTYSAALCTPAPRVISPPHPTHHLPNGGGVAEYEA